MKHWDFESTFRKDWRPTPKHAARTLAAVQAAGVDTSPIEDGVYAFAGGRPEPGDDEMEADATEDEGELTTVGAVAREAMAALAEIESHKAHEQRGKNGWRERAARRDGPGFDRNREGDPRRLPDRR